MSRQTGSKESPILELMSIREAALRLNRDPYYIRGVILGMGIELVPAPPSLLIRWEDFELLRKRVQATDPIAKPSRAKRPIPI